MEMVDPSPNPIGQVRRAGSAHDPPDRGKPSSVLVIAAGLERLGVETAGAAGPELLARHARLSALVERGQRLTTSPSRVFRHRLCRPNGSIQWTVRRNDAEPGLYEYAMPQGKLYAWRYRTWLPLPSSTGTWASGLTRPKGVVAAISSISSSVGSSRSLQIADCLCRLRLTARSRCAPARRPVISRRATSRGCAPRVTGSTRTSTSRLPSGRCDARAGQLPRPDTIKVPRDQACPASPSAPFDGVVSDYLKDALCGTTPPRTSCARGDRRRAGGSPARRRYCLLGAVRRGHAYLPAGR